MHPEGDGKVKWKSLEHRGIFFAEANPTFGLKLKIKVITISAPTHL